MRGRLRMRLDGVKHQPGLAAQLRRQLMGVAGIRRVDVTPRTGSVLLSYDPGALRSAAFLDELSTAMGALFPGHFAPGRARLRVDLLKGRPQLAHKIQQQLAGLHGIQRLEIDPSDGGCLILYESQAVTSPAFFDALCAVLGRQLPGLNVKKLLARTGLAAR